MPTCSNEFPTTEVLYAEIGDDVTSIVFLTIATILTVVCIGIFVEELVFLQRIEYENEAKLKKVATLLGLFPATMLCALVALFVPTSSIIVDLIATCYVTVCFYTFVTLTIDYFGGDDGLVETLADDKVGTNTPPCCCCCCCILKPVILTRKRLLIYKLFCLQVAVVRPFLLFIAAVLWTDGRYSRNIGDGSTSYVFITVVTVISMLVSLYGTSVIYRGTRPYLHHYRITAKFVSFQLVLVLVNVQNGVFGILSRYDIPECIGSRGPVVRANGIQHAILIIETFLLCLLARRGYRMDESGLGPPRKLEKDPENASDTPIKGNESINSNIDDRKAKREDTNQYGTMDFDNVAVEKNI